MAPTEYRPGSPGKIEVLCERVRLGLPLWHPLDAPAEREGEHGEIVPPWAAEVRSDTRGHYRPRRKAGVVPAGEVG